MTEQVWFVNVFVFANMFDETDETGFFLKFYVLFPVSNLAQVNVTFKELCDALGVSFSDGSSENSSTVPYSSNSSRKSSKSTQSSSSSRSKSTKSSSDTTTQPSLSDVDATCLFTKHGVLKKAIGQAHKGWTLISTTSQSSNHETFDAIVKQLNEFIHDGQHGEIQLVFNRRTLWQKNPQYMYIYSRYIKSSYNVRTMVKISSCNVRTMKLKMKYNIVRTILSLYEHCTNIVRTILLLFVISIPLKENLW